MASTVQLLLQLLLLASLGSASHHWGGTTSISYKGRNHDGTVNMELRARDTYDSCNYNSYYSYNNYYYHYWYCYGSNCGSSVQSRNISRIDTSTNTPSYESQWCETENIEKWTLRNDKPFNIRAASCCWISTRNSVSNWRFDAHVDFGTRSDTHEPNKLPDIAVLPFIRVPQNCPRTYKLAAFDPDGDRVRCRYGNLRNYECDGCSLPPGFHLDQNSCTLRYQSTSYDSRIFALEMVVEDYNREPINLYYSDGTVTRKNPTFTRRKRQVYQTAIPWNTSTMTPGWGWNGRTPTTAAAYATSNWGGWQPGSASHTTSNSWRQPGTTTSPTTRTPSWWQWWHSTQQQRAAPTTPPWWHPTTTPPTTTTPSWWQWWQSTQQHRAAPTTPPWWWYPTTTTTTTTPSWWQWWHSTPQQRAAPTTPPWWWHPTTTSPPVRNTTPRWWWWYTTQPPRAVPTTPRWWWHPTTTTPPSRTTTPWWWWRTTAAHWRTTPQPQWSASPLSKQPLQFSFLVDPSVSSCQEGVYLPRFLAPTPADEERIVAEVDKELEIRIKASATYSTIQNIIFSGPTNITKHRTTQNEFVLRWTPVSTDLGDHFPVCFAVESSYGASRYQSEMRCVLVEVKEDHIKADVTCGDSTMKVEVEKASFYGLQEDHLRLNDPTNTICSLERYSNNTHIVAIFPLSLCGTQIEEDEDNLIFKNAITTEEDDHSQVITRKHLLEVRFDCQYPKRTNLTLGFKAHRDNVTVWEKGLGTFTYQFEFYRDVQFRTMEDPNSYPLEYDVGKRIFMQIDASSSVNNTEMFVESCRASPFDVPNSHPTYSIIENGCKVDSTVQIHSPNEDNQFRFSMEAFKFIGLLNEVYISCSVMMCEAGNPNTRCSQGCRNSHNRYKRDATIQSQTHFVSQGPIRILRSAEPAMGSALNLNLNLVFIAGCLLVAVGMVCAVLIYKTKMSGVKYQPLPSSED